MENRDKLIKKFITKYFVLSFFEGLNFLAPYLAIMFNDYGLNARQISFIFSATLLTQLIFEIPGGAFADRFGRKNTLILSNIFYILSIIVLLFAKNFIVFSIFSGISLSLTSGTRTALIYDNMKSLNIERKFTQLRGKSKSVKLLGMSLGAFGASYLVKLGYNYVIMASFISNLFNLFVIILLKDSFGKNTENIKKLNQNYWRIIVKSIKYMLKHITIFKFTLYWALLFSITKVFEPFRKLFLLEITSKKELVGILISIQMIIMCICQWLFTGFVSKMKTAKVISIFVFGASFLLIGFIYYSFPLSYFLAVLCWSLYSVYHETMAGNYQKLLSSRWRSTIISINTFANNIFAIAYLFIFGFLSDKFSYKNGFIITASYQLILAGIFVVVLGYDKHLRKRERRLR